MQKVFEGGFVTWRQIFFALKFNTPPPVSRKSLFYAWIKQFDIISENIGKNTEYCSDSNGNAEFKCECNEGFDGKRCEDECFLECHNDGICMTEINSTTGIMQSNCLCTDNFTG